MAGERLLRILARLSAYPEAEHSSRLCQVAAEMTSMSGAGIMLMSGDLAQGSLCSSNDTSAKIEDLQYTLGEGPCVDAYHQDRPVLEPDLADPDTARWLAFTPLAVEVGVRAIFGFPIQIGVARIGALNLYCDRPGGLTKDQHADSLVMADVAAKTVVAMQSKAPPGAIAADLEAGANLRFVVHQASGMLSVQLGVSVGEALIRMRAYAFSNDRPLDDVARDIVARRVRFDDHDRNDRRDD
jgi:ANTAR domain/GAF domain